MKRISELHDEAMSLADEAEQARRRGDLSIAKSLAQSAFELERSAAMQLLDNFSAEPTRSVLFRSAAALAVDAGMSSDAVRMIGLGLGGDAPPEIAAELSELLEHITFQRHLQLRGVALEEQEVQLSIAGPAVDFGLASSHDFIGRVKIFEKWLKHTAERRAQSTGASPHSVAATKRDVSVYLSIPRAASFAVSLRVGKPSPQRRLQFDNFEANLIDEILDQIELVENGQEHELATRLGDPDEVRTVIGFVKGIAPNKDDVDVVGFTAWRSGSERRVALRRPRSDIRVQRSRASTLHPPEQFRAEIEEQMLSAAASLRISVSDDPVQVRGRLLYANATESTPVLRLKDDNGLYHNILVTPTIADAIVKPYWSEYVVIIGYPTPDGIRFEDIQPA